MKHQKLFNLIDNYSLDIDKNGVYAVYHISEPNRFYIGSCCRKTAVDRRVSGCYNRWIEHYSRLENNKHDSIGLQNNVNNYGLDGIRFKQLECIDSLDKNLIRVRENFFIKKFYKEYSVYNSFIGTGKGCVPESIRLQHRKRMIENNPMKIKSVVDKCMKSCKNSIIEKNIVLQYTLDGIFVKEYKNAKKASNIVNVNSTQIIKCLNNKAKSSAGFIWVRKIDFTEDLLKDKVYKCSFKAPSSHESNIKKGLKGRKKVCRIDSLNGEKKLYNSLKDAGLDVGVDPSNISRCCIGESKYSAGYNWEFICEKN